MTPPLGDPSAVPVVPGPGEPFTLAQLGGQHALKPRRRGRGWIVTLVVLGSAALVAAAVGVTYLSLAARSVAGPASVSQSPTGAATFTMIGTLTVTKLSGVQPLDIQRCVGDNGYDDISPGVQVTVTSADGKVIGVGRLQAGRIVPGVGCAFDFEVVGVPRGGTYYGVEIGRRGTLRYPEAEAMRRLEMTLGS